MKLFLLIISLIGLVSSGIADSSVSSETELPATDAEINFDISELLRRITSEILNSRKATPQGSYEVTDDGTIRYINHDDSVEEEQEEEVSSSSSEASSETSTTTTTTTTTTTPEPNLLNDEVTKDVSYDQNIPEWNLFDGGSTWEFISRKVDVYDPLRDPNEFPHVDTNEVEFDPNEETPEKFIARIRSRRDVKVDVGGQGGGSNGGVDVAVNKPGSNVNVNVGIEQFLNSLGAFFNKPVGGPGAGYGQGSASASGVAVNVNKPGYGSGSNVDVNVGGNGGGKPMKGGYGSGSNTAVNVDWASFIPFINVGVNKNGGASDVNVDVGGQNGGKGNSFVDVKVNKGHPKKVPHEEGGVDVHESNLAKKKVDVNVFNGFVDVKVDGEHDFPPQNLEHPPPPPPPHHGDDFPAHPPKHPKKHRKHHDDGDKNVSVNVGGQNGASWWPFVNVAVDSENTKSAGGPDSLNRPKKCININVPFVNVLLNRGCTPEHPGEGSP